MIHLTSSFSGQELGAALADDGEELGYALVELSEHHAGEMADEIEETTNMQVAEWLIEIGQELKKLHEKTEAR